MMMSKPTLLSLLVALVALPSATAFMAVKPPSFVVSPLAMSTYSVDQSDYSPKDSDYEKDDDWASRANLLEAERTRNQFDSVELKPVPMSKNAGNRFLVMLWDKQLDRNDREVFDLHTDRIEHTEDHVMYCRKSNLYNETFNAESVVDVLWSRQVLSADLQRVIGQAMCLEAAELTHVNEFLEKEPLVDFLTGGDIADIPIFRWRHIRDYSLRRDDGRYGTPCMLLSFDDGAETDAGDLRQQTNLTHLEYLMRSERVIAAGPLHVCTEDKDDPASTAIGDLILFNAVDRDEAIRFAEQEPRAEEGLYKSMQVHFYNNLDVTGKFVAENRFDYEPVADMKEAMDIWGYPVADEQTPWLNW